MNTLTWIFLSPLIGALALIFVPRTLSVVMRGVAILATFISACLSVLLFIRYNGAIPGPNNFRWEYQRPWVESLGISFHIGVDGINLGLILMGAILAFTAACVSWEIRKREKEFYILLLVMAGGILGAFASLDLFFFYFFHEFALIPTFIMVGVWGRGEQKNYAAFQITLYLSIGAFLALVGLIALYLQSGAGTFDIPRLVEVLGKNRLSGASQNLIFPLLLFGFGILVSLWPFHSWAPLGYRAAPTPTAMLHAGVLKKFGLYGLIRIAVPLMPDAARSWSSVLAVLCLGNLLYCGWVAMKQRDLKYLFGYSSVAHMGFVFLGIASLNPIGLSGAVLVMVAHGFLAALSFAVAGYIEEQTGTLDIGSMGGLLRRLPFIGAVLMIAAFAACGLPGFANFAGEITVLFGAWGPLRVATVLTAWGALLIGAIYMLRAVRNILHGPLPASFASVVNANIWRKTPFVILIASLLVFGFFPRLLMDKITPGTTRAIQAYRPPGTLPS